MICFLTQIVLSYRNSVAFNKDIFTGTNRSTRNRVPASLKKSRSVISMATKILRFHLAACWAMGTANQVVLRDRHSTELEWNSSFDKQSHEQDNSWRKLLHSCNKNRNQGLSFSFIYLRSQTNKKPRVYYQPFTRELDIIQILKCNSDVGLGSKTPRFDFSLCHGSLPDDLGPITYIHPKPPQQLLVQVNGV